MIDWYFTSDLHFNHTWMSETFRNNCCQYKNTYQLIRNWNNTVSRKGVVVIAGDMFWGKWEQWIWDALNGNKIIVKGNHDQWLKGHDNPIHWFDYYSKTLKFDNGKKIHICVSHYPLRTWNRKQHGAWQLHGHSHGALPPYARQLDVGVDNAKIILGQYRPFKLEEVYYLLEGKTL